LEKQIAALEREHANSDHMSLQSEKGELSVRQSKHHMAKQCLLENTTRSLIVVLRELEMHLRADNADVPDIAALLDDTPAAKKALCALQSRLGEIAPLGGVIVSPASPSKNRNGASVDQKLNRLEAENEQLRQRIAELEAAEKESEAAATETAGK
jgi:hypothetical protein